MDKKTIISTSKSTIKLKYNISNKLILIFLILFQLCFCNWDFFVNACTADSESCDANDECCSQRCSVLYGKCESLEYDTDVYKKLIIVLLIINVVPYYV